jgi:hypothetical protein
MTLMQLCYKELRDHTFTAHEDFVRLLVLVFLNTEQTGPTVTLLNHIREVLGFNIRHNSAYPH